jgi:hypothetical protein
MMLSRKCIVRFCPFFILQIELIFAVDGHYLNLPVVEADGRLVAIVDVLKLTYATLEQVRTLDPLSRITDIFHLDEFYEC